MKKRIFVISLSCLVALILAGCVTTLQSYKPKTPDEASIKELLLKWESTWNAHDVSDHLALWNAKAQIMYGRDRKIATKSEYSKMMLAAVKRMPETARVVLLA
jgi:hypothetical protein